MLLAFIGFWVLCAFLNYGFVLGSFTKEFPSSSHLEIVWISVMGPIALAAFFVYALVGRARISFLLVPYTKEQRWEIFNKEHPILGRAFFESFEK